MTARIRPVMFAAAFLAVALLLVPAALAAKGGGGGHKGGGGTTGGSGSISLAPLVTDVTGNGVANWGDSVTFNVSSTVSYPLVQLNCYQNGVNVDGQVVGFYIGYPWSKTFPLSTWMWTGGAADCTAVLYYQTSTGNVTLASTSFPVAA